MKPGCRSSNSWSPKESCRRAIWRPEPAFLRPPISRHLKVLREAGLVSQRAEGTRRLYSARPEGLRLIASWTRSRRAFWEGSLDRLETALTKEGK